MELPGGADPEVTGVGSIDKARFPSRGSAPHESEHQEPQITQFISTANFISQ